MAATAAAARITVVRIPRGVGSSAGMSSKNET